MRRPRASENGFRSLPGVPTENGFTLIEMLISLMIFGMITAAGVTLLTLTVRTQESADRIIESLSAVRRTGALLDAWNVDTAPAIGSPSGYLRPEALRMIAPQSTTLVGDQMFGRTAPAVARVSGRTVTVTSSVTSASESHICSRGSR